MAALKHSQQSLQRQLTDADLAIARKREEVKASLKRGAKSVALVQLKQVKQTEQHRDRRCDLLANLETLLLHIGMVFSV